MRFMQFREELAGGHITCACAASFAVTGETMHPLTQKLEHDCYWCNREELHQPAGPDQLIVFAQRWQTSREIISNNILLTWADCESLGPAGAPVITSITNC